MVRFLGQILLLVLLAGGVLYSALFSQTFAQAIGQTTALYWGNVVQVRDQGVQTSYGFTNPYQTVRVKVKNGDLSGGTITVENGQGYHIDSSRLAVLGDTVVVAKTVNDKNEVTFRIDDFYRLSAILPILIIFFGLIIVLSGWKGVGSIAGMLLSLWVIVGYIVPQILKGAEPLLISIIGCFGIMTTTIYLAHGFSKKTTIALVSTFFTLTLTGVLSVLFVQLTHITGLGSEEAYSLKLGPAAHINLKGLFLGGVLIGSLGVLDDVTTSLAAAIDELAKANPKYTFGHLMKSGMAIGREHISSLVNTLVLAYAGASLPIFLIIVLNPNKYPLWNIINSELIIQEVVRTLAGSIGLIFAVPFTTVLAAYFFAKRGSVNH